MMHVRSYHLSRRFCDLLLASSGTLNLQPPSTKVSTLAASLGGGTSGFDVSIRFNSRG